MGDLQTLFLVIYAALLALPLVAAWDRRREIARHLASRRRRAGR